MKMKKYLTLGLSVIGIVGMIGCSANNTLKDSESQNTNISKDNELKGESKENEKTEETIYLGKVKNIVGNEIELAKDQDINPNGSKLPEGVHFQSSIGGDSDSGSGGIPLTGDGEVGDSSEGISKDSVSMDPGEVEGELFDLTDIGDNEKLELEYTGETIKITIPAGANIFDMRAGSDSKLSAIKVNSIIKIFAEGTKEDITVKSVDIVE